MDKNINIAKELVKIAKNLIAIDEEGDVSRFQSLIDHDNFEQNQFDSTKKADKKYILYKKEGGLWIILACKDFGNVKKGDMGGLIRSEDNLSHDGNCWVYRGAEVYDRARVSDNALIYDDAILLENAEVGGNAKVFENAIVSGKARVYGNAQVYGNAEVVGYNEVYDDAEVYGNAKVFGEADVYGRARVYGDAMVYGNTRVYDKAEVYGNAQVYGTADVFGNAKVDYNVSEGEITE